MTEHIPEIIKLVDTNQKYNETTLQSTLRVRWLSGKKCIRLLDFCRMYVWMVHIVRKSDKEHRAHSSSKWQYYLYI